MARDTANAKAITQAWAKAHPSDMARYRRDYERANPGRKLKWARANAAKMKEARRKWRHAHRARARAAR